MTQFSLSDIEGESPQKVDINALLDKQRNGLIIENMVANDQMTYIEATVQWMEENSIPEGNHSRYIPLAIIDKIKNEAIKENLLRPSMAKTQQTNSLEFLL
ncbi:late promoter transcription accessory protein [Erwinia phage FBB1]|nr:late promoter transcription accessory protein [Erwinia phage FBB1]